MAKSKGLPSYHKKGQSAVGGRALESDHRISKDGRGEVKGTSTTRHHSVKPSADSGTVGSGQPLQAFQGGKDYRNTTLAKKYISTKPKR